MSSSTTYHPGDSCRDRFQCKEPLYKNTQHCVLHDPTDNKVLDFNEALKIKLGKGDFDFRSVWFPAKADFHNFEFGSEVNFKGAIFRGEAEFTEATFAGRATFRSVRFHAGVRFRSATFQKNVTFRRAIVDGEVNFNSALFKQPANLGAHFKAKCDFSQSEFNALTEFTDAVFEKDANFYKAKFLSISRFDDAKFIEITNFDEVLFHERVNFNATTFNQDVNFRGALFEDRVLFDFVRFGGQVDFHLATFQDFVRFQGHEVFTANFAPHFREVKFSDPKLVSFHSLSLRPSWFVEVDATEFALTNVNWHWNKTNGNWEPITVEKEIAEIIKDYKELPSRRLAYPLLRIACWNLAVNAEENHRYEEASKFRYLAMESDRLRLIHEADSSVSGDEDRSSVMRYVDLFRGYWQPRITLPGIYRLLSGYGEDIKRALIMLIGIWAVFGAIYAVLLRDRTTGDRFWFRRGLSYSAAVLTLQRPEPPPSPGIPQALVTLEVILGPVQAALLALAIRRKFMR